MPEAVALYPAARSSRIESFVRNPIFPAVLVATIRLLVHLTTNGGYGYFRDELYFLAGADHLDWGYVDHAPLIAVIAKVSLAVFGDSIKAIRFLPAVSGALVILLTGLITRELGGGRTAIAIACTSLLLAPISLGLHTLFSMNAFEPLFWMGSAYVLLIAIRRENPKLLVWFGLLAGIGLQNKHTMLFWGGAVFMALLATSQRRWLLDKWIWIAFLIAMVFFLPNVIWQWQNSFPTIEDLNNVRRIGKNVELPPLQFLWQQILYGIH